MFLRALFCEEPPNIRLTYNILKSIKANANDMSTYPIILSDLLVIHEINKAGWVVSESHAPGGMTDPLTARMAELNTQEQEATEEKVNKLVMKSGNIHKVISGCQNRAGLWFVLLSYQSSFLSY